MYTGGVGCAEAHIGAYPPPLLGQARLRGSGVPRNSPPEGGSLWDFASSRLKSPRTLLIFWLSQACPWQEISKLIELICFILVLL